MYLSWYHAGLIVFYTEYKKYYYNLRSDFTQSIVTAYIVA